MWLYARRKKGILGNKSPYYPHRPYEGFVRKIEIESDRYYDFMIYNRKLSFVDLLTYKLVYIGTIIDDEYDEY